MYKAVPRIPTEARRGRLRALNDKDDPRPVLERIVLGRILRLLSWDLPRPLLVGMVRDRVIVEWTEEVFGEGTLGVIVSPVDLNLVT